MPYNHRTILRHLGLAIFLLYFPFLLRPNSEVWIWYEVHWVFFSGLSLQAILIGFLADYGVRHDWIHQILPQNSSTTKLSKQDNFYAFVLLKWGKCSRCVSWWSAGCVGFGMSILYWEFQIIWWQTLIPWLLFASLAASIGATSAVSLFFFRKFYISSKKKL